MPKTTFNSALAFDFGMKRIGVAIGQSITQSATPLPPLTAKDGVPNWSLVKTLIDEWEPDVLIVGVPLNMDGSNQLITNNTKQFIQELKEKFQISVFETDERLTTKASRDEIFSKHGYKGLKKMSIDGLAAALILEQWMQENV